MRLLSRYTYRLENETALDSQASALLYNTFTDGLMQVPAALYRAIETQDVATMQQFPEELKLLQDEGFVTKEGYDEFKELSTWYDAFIHQREELALTILLSYRCNFGCSYCFEAKFLGNVRMSEPTKENILAWTKQRLEENKINRLYVTFFGGEPLVEQQTLFYLAENLKSYCESTNRPFGFGLITNGFHLNRELYEKLKSLGLRHVKVTLDGDKEEHDKQRPLKGGRGSFEAILKNLKDIGVLTSFTLGGNFDSTNPKSVDSFVSLIDRLESKGLARTVGRFAFKPILDPKLSSTQSFVTHLGDGNMAGFLKIEAELHKRQLPSMRKVTHDPCEALMEHSIAIDPHGDLYPCGAFAGDKRACIGNVATGYNEQYEKIMSYNPLKKPKCSGCQQLPSCFGGCRWVALKERGDYAGEVCQQSFFEKAVPALLRMENGL